MKFCSLRRLATGLLILMLAGPLDAQQPPQPPPAEAPFLPGAWWRDFRKELGLTDDQSSRIDAIFRTTMTTVFRPKRTELEEQEAELSRLIKADADEGTIARQSDRVEAVRAMLNKNRTLMLVRIRAVLTQEQRAKLNTLRDQWERDNQPPPRTNDRPGPDRDRRPQGQRQDSPRSPR